MVTNVKKLPAGVKLFIDDLAKVIGVHLRNLWSIMGGRLT